MYPLPCALTLSVYSHICCLHVLRAMHDKTPGNKLTYRCCLPLLPPNARQQ